MKKVLFLSLIFSVLLTGCFTSTSTGDSTIVTSESTSTKTTTQTSKEETKNQQTQVSQTEATKTETTQSQASTSESQTSLTQTETERSSSTVTTAIPTTTSAPMGKVTLEAYQFGYNPQVVTIKLGQPTEITFIARDVAHGFKNSSLGIDVQVEPGSPVKLIVTPDEAKDYEIKCHVFCGSGHRDMEAIIRVVP